MDIKVAAVTGVYTVIANANQIAKVGTIPPNGNPGTVPPWLQNKEVVGTGPVTPDTPTIM